MAGQVLETLIVINAKAGNGFSQVGSTLQELGSLVDGVSEKLIEFGTDSVNVYRDYEKSMASAEVALSTTYGKGTQQLNTVMEQLDVAATEWAATTIFHTNDVGNAISEAAHAGWDFEQIMYGIPAAMRLAQAGGLDLSTAVDYIVKSTNAAGIGFEDMGDFIDLWTFGANSSASTIGEFGDAMLRMGSTMRWAADPAELMTLIAVTANAGSVGSEAGTMIRNSIMRLIAPTDKASLALEKMGATALEAQEVMGDEGLAAAYKELQEYGFKGVFDENGNIRSILDVYTDMALVLGEMAGGMENISTNEKAISVLSAIFPTRTITEAVNLINAAANGYDGLYDKMINGEAAGYGQYSANTMMDTLDGKIETFASKVERLKQLVGEDLSGDIENAAAFGGDLVDGLAGMDEGTLDALVHGLGVVALSGPGLIAVGGALRFIGHLLSPTGLIGVGVISLGALVAAINELQEADFAGKFGTMELDNERISGYIDGLAEDFEKAYSRANRFSEALDAAVESYTTASSSFSSKLLTASLTELTDEDINGLTQLGNDMTDYILKGINNSYNQDRATLNQTFGGYFNAIGDPVWSQIMSLLEEGHAEAVHKAESLGQQLRDAMTKAFEDGALSAEEVSDIMKIMDQQNELLAMQRNAENYEAEYKILRKAQTASLDELKTLSEEETERQNIVLENLYANQDHLRASTRSQLEYKVSHGEITQEEADATMATLEEGFKREEARAHLDFVPFTMRLYDQVIDSSDLAPAWAGLEEFADSYMSRGVVTNEALNKYIGSYSGNDRLQTAELMEWYIEAMGGVERIQNDIEALVATEGKTEEQHEADMGTAQGLMRLLAMYDLSTTTGYGNTVSNWEPENYTAARGYGVEDAKAQINAINEDTGGMMNVLMTELGKAAAGGGTSGFTEIMGSATDTGFISGLSNVVEQLREVYDLSAVQTPEMPGWLHDYAAAYMLMYNPNINAEAYRFDSEEYGNMQVPVEPVLQGDVDTSGMEPITCPIRPHIDGEDSVDALREQGVKVDVGADTTEMTATIDAADGMQLTEYIDGDATNLEYSITSLDGMVLTEGVAGNTAALAAAIAAYQGMTVTVNVRARGGILGSSGGGDSGSGGSGKKGYAEGGRATVASIFGEAGPEWAIPEEHSERTAELLNAAREASGFTWPDILSRFGGMNSDPGNRPATIVYSPTINAQDATGVEQVLLEDKRRLEKWFEEKKAFAEMEVYS